MSKVEIQLTMGIQGLIPFLEKVSKPTNVKEFSGGTVAIDAYCWLHKGVFSCADKLARGDSCDLLVYDSGVFHSKQSF